MVCIFKIITLFAFPSQTGSAEFKDANRFYGTLLYFVFNIIILVLMLVLVLRFLKYEFVLFYLERAKEEDINRGKIIDGTVERQPTIRNPTNRMSQ